MTFSLRDSLRLMPIERRIEFINSLSPEEQTYLLYDWTLWARDEQLPPDDPNWIIWKLITGRGWGKTRTGAEGVREHAEKGLTDRIALVGQTTADVRDVMIEGESGILACSPPWFKPEYTPSRRRVLWPNGVQAFTYSSEDPDQLRGPQHGLAWADEPAAWKYPDKTWSNLMFGLRLRPGRAIVTTTPRPIKLIKDFVQKNAEGEYLRTGTTFDNLANLSPVYRRLISQYEGTTLGRQELLGVLLLEIEGALWKLETIDKLRVEKAPEDLIRVVVSVDPAVSSDKTSDETGIIVAGTALCKCKGTEEIHGFVLDDLTVRATPNDWAKQVIRAYREFLADKVVAEVNNGGDLVENTIRTLDRHISYKAVHATRGKHKRAEPVAALYEQDKVHHVGQFATLEDQMTTWTPESDESPDHMDALVWALTELMVGVKDNTLVAV